MSKTWKWILGITLGLVILVGLGFVAATFLGYGHMSLGRSAYYGHPMMDEYGFNGRGPMGGYNNDRHPMMDDYGFRGRHPMMGYGFSPFGGIFMGFGMLLIWTVPLGLLFLIIYGAVRLANKPNARVAAQSCSNCGKAVQVDWKNCPYCGTTL